MLEAPAPSSAIFESACRKYGEGYRTGDTWIAGYQGARSCRVAGCPGTKIRPEIYPSSIVPGAVWARQEDAPCFIVCAPCQQIIGPFVRHKTLPDSPTGGIWSKLVSLGTTRVFRALALFWDIMHYEEQCFDTAGTWLCSRGSVLLILSLLSVCGPSQYSQYSGRQNSNTPITRTTICFREYICETFFYVTLSTKKQLFRGGGILCLLYLTEPVTKCYGATLTSGNLFVLNVNAAYIELIARVICSGSISTDGYIVVVMTPN